MPVRAFLAAVVLLAAPHARADVTPDDAARAKALFERAQADADAGRVEKACDEFDRSAQLDPQIGTLLNLADCRERQGRRADAYALFEKAERKATRAGDGRDVYAHRRLAALGIHLTRLTIRVADPAPRETIAFNGRALAEDAWNEPQLVDEGIVVVEATAPSRRAFRTEVHAHGGGAQTIDVPALLTDDVRPRGVGTLPYAIAAGGGVLVVISIALAVDAKERWTSAYNIGDAAGVRSAQNEANVATGVAIAGAVAIGTGVVLYLVRKRDRVVVAPTGDRNRIGLAIAGVF